MIGGVAEYLELSVSKIRLRLVAQLKLSSSLFAEAHSGAERTEMIYSFLASCKTLEVNPLELMTDVLQRLGSYPVNRTDELLPGIWKKLEV